MVHLLIYFAKVALFLRRATVHCVKVSCLRGEEDP